ncbi:MAG: Mur ligase family protein, partial [Kiritimatiellia bacterium]
MARRCCAKSLKSTTALAGQPAFCRAAVSSAIEDDNPELAAARRFKAPILHRTDLLAQLAEPHTLLGVAGTAGKTTTTGMLGWTLECLGADPTVINGGALVNWRSSERIGNFRRGSSGLWIMELDESDRSLLKFKPERAIITNISKDHFNLEETQRLFNTFARQVKSPVMGCRPNAEVPEFPAEFQPRTTPAGSSFQYRGVGFQLQVPGRHNAANAMLCAMLCENLGHPLPLISAALAEFRGLERRLEHVGSISGINIFDDYAHNPAKISAAWETLA